MSRFKTGTRAEVLRHMAECAIRDRQAMVEACTPRSNLFPRNPENEQYIAECKAAIADFRRIAGLAAPQEPQR